MDVHVQQADLVRLATEQTTVGFALADLHGALREANPAMCALVGRSRDELLTLRFQDITHPGDLPGDVALVEQIEAGRIESFRERRRYLRPDGSVVHADIALTGVRVDGELAGFAAFVVDVTHEVSTQERLRALIDTMLDPWVQLEALRDPQGRIVDFVYRDANSAACRYNDLEYDELVGQRLLDLLPEHVDSGLLERYAEVVDTGVPLVLDDSPFPSGADGRARYFDNRAVKAGDGISFTWREVTDRVENREALAQKARLDPLTGLANRNGLLEGIDAAFERAPRLGAQIAVLYCDVDGLKVVNDTYGHRAGDHLLQAVADRMSGAVRRDDLVARIGGDEFVVVAVGITDDDAALALAAKVAEAVSRTLVVDQVHLMPRISIGVAVAREGQGPEVVLESADRALYRQKHRAGDAQAVPEPGDRSLEPDGDTTVPTPAAPRA